MVWEQNVELIVMLTSVTEGGRKKCEQYWPNAPGKTVSHAGHDITCVSVRHNDVYDPKMTVTTLKIRGDEAEERTLHHIQYLAWPDHGVPSSTSEFLATMQEMLDLRTKTSDRAGYTLIHCSAGVGRTGALLLTWIMTEKLKRGLLPDAASILTELREQRAILVQTAQQYQFAFRAAKDWLAMQPQQ
jgi:tyrosine-protein phosphatase non-receptor type 3